jgi:hypothetical protein
MRPFGAGSIREDEIRETVVEVAAKNGAGLVDQAGPFRMIGRHLPREVFVQLRDDGIRAGRRRPGGDRGKRNREYGEQEHYA